MQRIVQTTAVFRTKFGGYGSVGFRPPESGYTGQLCDQKTHGHTVCLKIRMDIYCIYTHTDIYIFIKGSLDEKLPSYEVLKMLRE